MGTGTFNSALLLCQYSCSSHNHKSNFPTGIQELSKICTSDTDKKLTCGVPAGEVGGAGLLCSVATVVGFTGGVGDDGVFSAAPGVATAGAGSLAIPPAPEGGPCANAL